MGGGGGIRGHLDGKESLFRIDASKAGKLCAGYLGGRRGTRTRFCVKEVDGFMKFCCASHSGEKFNYAVKSYYIRMSKDSALCSPCVSLEQLQAHGSSGLTAQKHTSKDWLQILEEFQRENGTWNDHPATPPRSGSAKYTFDEDAMEVEGDVEEEESKPRAVVEVAGDRKTEELEFAETAYGDQAVLKPPLRVVEAIRPVSEAVKEILGRVDAMGTGSDDLFMMKSTLEVIEATMEVLPRELDDVDHRFNEFADFTRDKLKTVVTDYENFYTDLYGDEDDGAFVAAHGSFAAAVDTLIAELGVIKESVERSRMESNVALAKAELAKSEVDSLDSTWKTSVDTMAEIIRSLSNRFNSEIASLAERLSAATGGPPGLRSLAAMATPTNVYAPYYAAYAHKPTGRVTIGNNVKNYNRLTDNGFNVVKLFDTEEEMNMWFAAHGPVIGDLFANPAASPAPSPGEEPASGSSEGGIAAQISGLISLIEELKVSNATLTSDVVELKRAAFSGNVRVGEFSFDSEEDIVSMLIEDNVPSNAYGVAVDASSFFAHFHDGSVDDSRISSEIKTMRHAGINDAVSLRYITTFRQSQPPYFLNSSNIKVNEGDRFPMFENAVAWEGRSSVTGARRTMEKNISDTTKLITTYIDQHVGKSTQSSRLFHLLKSETQAWYTKLIAHFNHELQAVQQYGIPEKETFTLVSNELNKIFQTLWEKRMLMQEFSPDCDQQLFLARTVWITMQAHMIMDDFADPAFETHTLISSIFIRFLAEETGSNFSSGLKGTIDELKGLIATTDANASAKAKAITRCLDSLTDNVKKLCAKTEVKYVSGKVGE